MRPINFIFLVTSFALYVTSFAQMTGVIVEVDTVFYEPTTFNSNGDPLYAELEGYVTYKLFAEFTNPGDQLSSIYSDAAILGTEPFYIDAPCGCFNPALGDVMLGGAQNEALFAFFPEVVYDTYWTLGFAQGEQMAFSNPAYNSLNMCSEQEEAGFIFTVTPAAAGDDLRIQFAQVTTCGPFSFEACFQVFVNGNQTPYQEWCMTGDGPGIVTIEGPIEGCTDPEAMNFNPLANYPDGTCEFGVPGCTDSTAMNFDPESTIDDGSCLYFEPSCAGIGETATNTWKLVETGFYPDTLFATHGEFISPQHVLHLSDSTVDITVDGNEITYEILGFVLEEITDQVTGMNISSAQPGDTLLANEQWCLWLWGAPQSVGTYEVLLEGTLLLNASGGELAIPNQYFSLPVLVDENPEEVLGCLYEEAYNFNTYANTDNGSCIFGGCTDTNAINYDETATASLNECLYVGCTNESALNYGGPPGLMYDFEEITHELPYPLNFGLAFEYVSDDWMSEVIDLGWEFTFFGEPLESLQVSSNGYLLMDDYDSNYSQWQIGDLQLPSSQLPSPAIFPVFSDLNPYDCGQIFYGTAGEAPNRSFVVSWNQVCLYQSACQNQAPVSAQVVLHETTNQIEFHLVHRGSCPTWNDDGFIIGLQSQDGFHAAFPTGFNNETAEAAGLSWIAHPFPQPGPSLDDGSCLFVGCTDPMACNYDAAASEDDGSCAYLSEACGEGTVWDQNTQTCIPTPEMCGSDVDGDGLVAVGDLLLVLADFGNTCTE